MHIVVKTLEDIEQEEREAKQLELLQEVQGIGYNVVTCADCETVLIVKKDEPTECAGCGLIDDANDTNPDLWY